ncbi:Tripeptidyl-peptidase sed2 [Paecilomyces lecythidis]|uniref:tripeptidyl-peptidase II n=1 Tax=Paecilomyces lecythidis TaxID=3004212 RepID=A0ABR3XAA3_9EURO
MFSSVFLLGILSLLLSLSTVPAVPLEYDLVERLPEVPYGWFRGATPAASKLLSLRLAVHQDRAAEFEQLVIDLSTPGHKKYGKHLKQEEIRDFLRPASRVSQAILAWLESEGVPEDSIENDGDWINIVIPVQQAERMLRARFYYFHNIESRVTRIRTLEYSLPHAIRPYIQLIQPTTRFGEPHAHKSFLIDHGITISDNVTSADCGSTVTPSCLRKLYKLDDFVATPNPRNKLGISGYLGQYARYSDFYAFLKTYAPNEQDANFTVTSINGGVNPQNSSDSATEAALDVQYGYSLSYGVNGTFYTTGGRGPLVPDADQPDANDSDNEPYLDQLHYLLKLPDDQLPSVLSTSYGEDEQSVPASYSNVTCNLFAQLGARGVSVIFSSGDSGVGSSCLSNDGKNTTKFLPVFPASCPFVTSVGGTTGVNPEKAVSFSAGGFSERFARPSYQEAAVSRYLARLGSQWKGLYNPKGRGFPDVATQANNFAIIDHGLTSLVGGTSAAAPTFAAIVADLNSVRLAANKSALGFLNPWIYSLNQTGFTDIVNGGSNGCLGGETWLGRSTPYVPYASWNATPGWDPVTGLGTPLFSTLSELALSA